MKTTSKIIFVILLITSACSCMSSGLDKLPTYSDAEITNIKFEYRWWNNNQMQVQELITTLTIDKGINTIECNIRVPDANAVFTPEIRSKVDLTNISCIADLSTAAKLSPLDGAPKLGIPSDYSDRNFKFRVTAADNNTSKTWTLQINQFEK